jgi:Na+-transporting NADH:ubiquinone oxidoreductase subunit NqrA
MDKIKQEELRKLVNEILSGAKQVGIDVIYDNYTEEELTFIEQEMYRLNTQDLNKFMQKLEASERH